MPERFEQLQEELVRGAHLQDAYDLNTINLIAPASPTPLRYFHNTVLKHNAIAEGLLGKRPYAGAEGFNIVEGVAVEAAKALFGAEHANVQPHSVSQANQAVYQALLKPGDRVLAMKFSDGGHLTHGLKPNFSGRFYDFEFYGTDATTGLIDYDALDKKASEFNTKLIVCGASSYPRALDFERLAEISHRVGSYLMADLSHPAGLIVGGKFPQPFPECDVVTLTLDKTMLGPHGGIVLAKSELAERIDKAVHPGVQSSIPLRRIYEMAQCLIDCSRPWFTDYIDRVVRNMKAFEDEFSPIPDMMVSGGSDTHLMVINTKDTFDLTGRDSETLLEKIGILTNRQVVPGEKLKPYVASGIRLGTSWITARGYSEDEARVIANLILDNLSNPNDPEVVAGSKQIVGELLSLKRANDVWFDEANGELK